MYNCEIQFLEVRRNKQSCLINSGYKKTIVVIIFWISNQVNLMFVIQLKCEQNYYFEWKNRSGNSRLQTVCSGQCGGGNFDGIPTTVSEDDNQRQLH